jgi:glycosyltransferase involved in cell wall biosynthesis
MNPEYVVLGGLFWKIMNKKIGLWYAHGHVPFTLRISEKLTNIIFTSTKSGFRLKSKKTKVVGQGIDTNYFKPLENKLQNDVFQIITVGRISPVKDYETLIKAAEILKKEDVKFVINIIGGVGLSEQKKYLEKMKEIINSKELNNYINFIGSVPNKKILSHLQKSDLFINMSHTGSLDKAILEAMSCELPVLTCNEALNDVLGTDRDKLMFLKRDYKSLAVRIKYIISMSSSDRESSGDKLRDIVIKNHNIDNFIGRIINFYESLYISK